MATTKLYTRTASNLYRYKSGIYFARLDIGTKTHWRSLETTVLTVAKDKLGDALRKIREENAPRDTKTMGDYAKAYLEAYLAKPDMKEKTRYCPASVENGLFLNSS